MRIRGRLFLLIGLWLATAQLEERTVMAATAADALVAHGIELRKQGKDDEALAEFQKALEMSATPRTRAQAALAEQALGLWVAAEADLLEALSHDRDDWVKKNATVLNKALTTIQSQIGTLQVWGTPIGAAVFVDGKPAGKLPLRKPIRVSGESVILTVTTDGFTELRRTVRVPAKETVREHVDLVPVTTTVAKPLATDAGSSAARLPGTTAEGPASALPTVPSDSTARNVSAADRGGREATEVPLDGPADDGSSVLRPLAWVAAAGAIGALTFGIVETVLRQRNRDAFNNYARPNPADPANPIKNYCSETNLPVECRGLKDKFDSSTTWMIVGYASAGVLAVGSGILFALAPTRNVPEQRASLACVPQLGAPGLTCHYAF